MLQAIVAYHQDHLHDWVAELQCQHFQHVRHNPPWVNRPWVQTSSGRQTMLGYPLNCKKCDQGLPIDSVNR